MTDTFRQLQLADLDQLCKDHVEESLTLEFKPCNELRIGTIVQDRGRVAHTRTREIITGELTKDVGAMLNSAGGTIIYGILEPKKSGCAERLDTENAFSGDDVRPETIIQILRANIRPTPTINVYRVFEDPGNELSRWYIVIDVPQGEQAYQSTDKRFYKRVGNIPKAMEQYEVVDVMNRIKGPALAWRLDVVHFHNPSSRGEHFVSGALRAFITSTNFIGSEYGQFRLSFLYPLRFTESIGISHKTYRSYNAYTGVPLEEYTDIPKAEAITTHWGRERDESVFPGDWYQLFRGANISIDVPSLSLIPDPTYLIQTEIFTMNSYTKKALYVLRRTADAPDQLGLSVVDPATYHATAEAFWQTYHHAASVLPDKYG